MMKNDIKNKKSDILVSNSPDFTKEEMVFLKSVFANKEKKRDLIKLFRKKFPKERPSIRSKVNALLKRQTAIIFTMTDVFEIPKSYINNKNPEQYRTIENALNHPDTFNDICNYLFMKYFYGYDPINGLSIAKDITQDTLLKACNNSGKYKTTGDFQGNLKGWLFKVGGNLAVNFLRKNKKNKESYQYDSLVGFEKRNDLFSDQPEIEEDTCSENYFLLLKFLENLSEDEKTVLNLLAQDYKYHEIEEDTGINLGTVRSIIFRIRKKVSETPDLMKVYHSRASKSSNINFK